MSDQTPLPPEVMDALDRLSEMLGDISAIHVFLRPAGPGMIRAISAIPEGVTPYQAGLAARHILDQASRAATNCPCQGCQTIRAAHDQVEALLGAEDPTCH